MATNKQNDDRIAKILKLPDNVINLIAAGEVIQRPANAVKELIENSLDAGATEIKISVKNGGTKSLKVVDNGTGIRTSDLELLCQRYTTSKLRQYDDLKSISTFGFRGEALASLSQISHLTVTTKTSTSVIAYRALYEGGRLKEKPKPCAGNPGTQITAEDLFYNMADRRQALKSAGEEMKKLTDVVGKYAIHNANVSFQLRRENDNMLDIRTNGGSGCTSTSTNDSSCPIRLAIGLIYGLPLSRELVYFRCDDARTTLSFTADGYVSNPGFTTKKFTFILFINNRLVECYQLKKMIESLYADYGPSKSIFPFIYLRMQIEPQNVDVNVHPTKQNVTFLHEKEIVETLETVIKKTLETSNISKTFLVKNFPSTTSDSIIEQSEKGDEDDVRKRQTQDKNGRNQKKTTIEAHSLVRTDGRGRKLDEFFESPNVSDILSQNIRVSYINFGEKETVDQEGSRKVVETVKEMTKVHVTDEEISVLYDNERRQMTSWRPIRLESILKLQAIVKDRSSPELRSFISNHIFVGCVDAEYVLLQYQTGLYLVNTTALSREFFYQTLLFKFGNFGALHLKEKCRLVDLLGLAIPRLPDQTPMDRREKAEEYLQILMSKSEMLWDYFALQFVDGYLLTIPWLLEKYIPQLEGLPTYLYRLATAVNWDDELEFFEGFGRETSKFYAFKKDYSRGNQMATIFDAAKIDYKSMLEHVLYPAMKSRLIPPDIFNDSKTIMKLTDVHDLYRVFERC